MRHRRRHRRWVAVVIVIAVLAGLGGTGIASLLLQQRATRLQAELTTHLRLGQADLEAAKASLKQANTSHDVNLVNKATVEFISAKTQFQFTRDIADSSRLLHVIEGMPIARDQARPLHSALDGVAEMGIAISDAGIELSALAAKLIAPPGGGQAGKSLLTVLDTTEKSLGVARKDRKRADAAAAKGDIVVVPTSQQATFAKARASIASGLAALDEFDQVVPVIREVFGANGPRNYLVEQVNPAELRPGGGFIGTYSVLRADQGTLKLIKSGNAYDLADPRPVFGQKGYVAPPGPITELIGDTSWSFIDSNFFPDFPSNASAAETFAAPRLGMKIDAVISIDYYTVAKLLELTGPMKISGYGVTVDVNNFIPTVVQSDLSGDPSHKAILAATAGQLMQTISSLPADRWPALLGALNALAGNRHLQVFFNNPNVESSIAAFGWSGALNEQGSFDFMAEVESNLGGTKANYFITRHYMVDLTRRGNLLHHQVTVDVTNNMPYAYRPAEYYKAYYRLFIPSNASGASDDLVRLRVADPSPPSGTQQLTGWRLFHGYGHTFRFTFQYDTPWPSNSRGRHRIYWQKQPGTADDKIDVTWNDGNGHTYSASSDLNRDRIIVLDPLAVAVISAPAAQAKIPSLSLGS